MDEAWSAIFAQEVATPAGVFLNINHDNNHHLNTLWLQWVGSDAAPLLQRALSIVSGTATVPVAAAIMLRRGTAPAVLTAIGFAFAPFLVTYGAEARGYAPLLFAWTVAIAMVDRWLDQPAGRLPSTGIALAASFGLLSQATMIFGLASLAGWVGIERMRVAGWRIAVRDSVRLFAPAAIVALGLIGLAFAAAATSPTGFQFGSREPHVWGKWFNANVLLWDWTLGSAAIAIPLALFGAFTRDRLGSLVLLATVALPLGVALAALPNSGVSPRYYAVAVPPMLLLASIALPTAWRKGLAWQTLAVSAAGVFFVTGIDRNIAIIRNLRGDPGRAVAVMAKAAPQGTTVTIDHSRSSAILIAAAWSQHYPLTVTPGPSGQFRLIERDGNAPFPDHPARCTAPCPIVAQGDPIGLSGSHWRLYRQMQ
ncbi:hypothetical protein DMC47_22400 [Nostoc sp. 3335mG]|nr:hypothetical protein DMC47_22400 [Nostoc sp. 3335mG]